MERPRRWEGMGSPMLAMDISFSDLTDFTEAAKKHPTMHSSSQMFMDTTYTFVENLIQVTLLTDYLASSSKMFMDTM